MSYKKHVIMYMLHSTEQPSQSMPSRLVQNDTAAACPHCTEIQFLKSRATCAKVGARPSATGEKVCWGPSMLKKLAGRGSSSVSVYTCLMPVLAMAATCAGLLGVADAASLHTIHSQKKFACKVGQVSCGK